MDKLTHRFQNGEVPEAAPFNAITDKVNAMIDAQGTILDASANIETLKEAIENLPDSQKVTLQVQQNTDDITSLQKHLGLYSKALPITLNHAVATNRILTTLPSGEVTQVAQQGWNISRIDIDGVVVTSGDTVFLPLRSAQGENLLIKGVVPFARLIETKDSEGQVVRQTIKSLYGASNTDICEWGGIKKELALRTGEALLVCHPAVITEVVIGRNAEDASSAAAQLRQEDALDEKANLSGFHGAMITGGAISLVPEKADDAMPAYTENLPAARMVGDAGALTSQTWAQGVYPHYPHVPDDAKGKRSSLSIERVEGECLGTQQLVPVDGGSVELQNGHKFLSIINGEYTIFTVSAKETRTYAKGDMLFDLTTKFPTTAGGTFVKKLTGNKSSALAVCNKLGYASVITYDE